MPVKSFEGFVKDLKKASKLSPNSDSRCLSDSFLDVENNMTMGNQFYYLLDIVEMNLLYLSKNFWVLLGYEAHEITGEFIFQLIHPEDRDTALKISLGALELSKRAEDLQPGQDVFAVDMRMKHKSGHYLRMLRQLGINKIDSSGNPIQAFALWTDITEIKKSNKMEFSYSGPNSKIFSEIQKLVNENTPFTTRELEVLKNLSNGNSAKEIATNMGISYETVISHKKNMRTKGNFSNTTELIKFGLEKGLV